MKLTTRLLIFVAIVTALAITASLFLFSANRQIDEASAEAAVSDQTVTGLVELSILTSDYLLSPSDRAVSQWQLKHNSIVEALDVNAFNSPEEQASAQSALQSLEKIETAFNQLIENEQQSGSAGLEVRQELNERLTGQISVELQRLLNISNRLKAESNTDLDSANQTSNLVQTGLLALLFVTILSFYLLTNISILRPIFSLTGVAESITKGQFAVDFPETENQNEIGVLSRAFRQMTNQLQDTLAGLEQRVADRTRNLELAAEVGRSVSQVRSLDIMLKDACELILQEFNLYYAQVYLTDPNASTLKLEAGTGTVGIQLLGRNHSLPFNTGSINGRAAVEKRSVVIADTTKSSTFRQNPLLPETRGEMAVPLIVADKVVGVLDMQSNEPGILTDEVLPAFEALAGQIAVAIQNANLLAETEQARAQVEAQARRLVREGWNEHLDAIHKPEQLGYVFNHNTVTPLADVDASTFPENGNAISASISVTGETLGSLLVEIEDESRREQINQLTNIVARQVAQQIENLRLLESAERFRAEAEQASRRLTRESWKSYADNAGTSLNYIYDLNQVRPLKDESLEESATVPLKVRDQKIGNLSIQGLTSENSGGVEIAHVVAERLSAHIESLRQYDQTQSALAQSEKLFESSRAITQATDLQELVKATVKTLNIPVVNRAILGAFSYDASGELETMTDIANWWNGTGTEVAPIGTSYSANTLKLLSVFLSDKPLYFNDTFNDERMGAAGLQVAKSLNIRSAAVLPLLLGTRQLGILMLQAEEPHNFMQDEIRLFSALAPQIATVLENRRQFERAQQQAQRESALNVINQKIQSATTVEAVLQIAARELGHALGAPMTIAQLSLKDNDSSS